MCKYCLMSKCPPGCPNYIPPHSNLYCSVCEEYIDIGQEYIENQNGEYAHWECVDYPRTLAHWLGYKIKTMEDKNEGY